jgi:hypothetical protein
MGRRGDRGGRGRHARGGGRRQGRSGRGGGIVALAAAGAVATGSGSSARGHLNLLAGPSPIAGLISSEGKAGLLVVADELGVVKGAFVGSGRYFEKAVDVNCIIVDSG